METTEFKYKSYTTLMRKVLSEFQSMERELKGIGKQGNERPLEET
jgi:hypothetical protein